MKLNGKSSDSIEFTSYDDKSREIIQLIDKLRDEGANFDLDLPTVVFCGNQSAGKSSLIEAISGINLPRSSGTCTRCPMELRLSSDSKIWKCNVFLQFKHDDTNGKYLDKPKEVVFQEDITNTALVELSVRRAQKAILNPEQNPSKFINYKFNDTSLEKKVLDSKSNQLYFTENIILIKIFGAKRNLTLIDLPGIIRATESKEEHKSIKLVEKLAKGYIKNPRSLILATISCKDEIENQAIMSLAKEVDPKGIRTIGVLTKPDTIEKSCHDSWFQVLNNKYFPLELGYYIIRNPNKQELDSNISFQEARKKEESFFQGKLPWSDAKSNLKLKMGIDNLRSTLSSQLTLLIEESLPGMRQKITELFDSTISELSTFPPEIDVNSKYEFISIFRAFATKIQEAADAKSNDKVLFQSIDSNFKSFGKALMFDRPMLHLPEIIRELKKDTQVNEDIQEYYIQFGESCHKSCFTVNKLQDIIDRQKGRELSGFIKNEALQEIIQHCQTEWSQAAYQCLQSIENEIREFVSKQIDLYFGRFKKLRHKISIKVDELIHSQLEETNTIIQHSYEMETEFPVTWDKSFLDSAIKKARSFYGENLNYIVRAYLEPGYALYPSKTTFKSTTNSLPNSSNSFGSKPLDSNIQTIMEITQAYYRLAQGRFGDLVPMLITKYFIHGVSKKLDKFIIESLKIFDGVFDNRLLEEDSRVSMKRKECSARLERLKIIKREINI